MSTTTNARPRHVWKKCQSLGVALLLHAVLASILCIEPATPIYPNPTTTTRFERIFWSDVPRIKPPTKAIILSPKTAPQPEPSIPRLPNVATVAVEPSLSPPPNVVTVVPKPIQTPTMMVKVRPRKRPPRQAIHPNKPVPYQPVMENAILRTGTSGSTQNRAKASAFSATPRSHSNNFVPEDTIKKTVSEHTGSSHTYIPPQTRATYLNNPKPAYPAFARRRGIQGTVLLTVKVDISGLPEEVTVKQGSGYAILDRSALRTVKRWRFVPAQRGGVAVRATVDVPIRFQLRDG